MFNLRLSNKNISLCVFFSLIMSGCSYEFTRQHNEVNDINTRSPQTEKKSIVALTEPDQNQAVSESRSETSEPQTILDSAIGFINASSDYWQQGDLDNSMAALDEAYSLILSIPQDNDGDIQQQKDDLRLIIARNIIKVFGSNFTIATGLSNAIPLDMNEHVERALNSFKGRDRNFFLRAYARSGRYRPAIVKALNEAGLPEELSWLPFIESGYSVRALSSARALGMWQFIASTGYKFGLRRDTWVDERMDPDKSTVAAIAYLKELHQMFGDWTTALAAYNCGEGRVARTIQSQHVNYMDNFWDLYRRLPSETAFYVPKFLAVLHIIKNPEKYGFTLPEPDSPIDVEKVTINRQAHLKDIASAIGVEPNLLIELNPELRQNVTPPTLYELRIPQGKSEVFASFEGSLPRWVPPRQPIAYASDGTTVNHRVKSGETLSSIAKTYKTDIDTIKKANNLKNNNIIAGAVLKIPSKQAGVSVAAITPRTTVPVRSSLSEATTSYRVIAGDSLWKIANRFDTTVSKIQLANGMEGTSLYVGQTLVIPGKNGSVIPRQDVALIEHTVASGESPYSIALKYEMDVSELLSLNNLNPRSTIYPGQMLKVKPKKSN